MVGRKIEVLVGVCRFPENRGRQGPIQRTLYLDVQEWEAAVIYLSTVN